MILRPYQQRAADYIRRRERQGQFRICLESPTGSGKTIILADLLLDPRRQVVESHRRVLLDQISRTLTAHGIPHTFRAAGRKYNPEAPICLSMVQTELRRFEKLGPHPDTTLVHIDEPHCMKGEKYNAIFNAYTNASKLGYTATPTDMAAMFDELYRVTTVPELIELGYLCQPRVFSCGRVDSKRLEKLRRDAMGEFLPGDIDRYCPPRIIIGYVLHYLKQLNPDRRPFILFAHSVKSSLWWAQMMTHKGVPTAHIDGDDVWVDGEFFKSDSAKRQEIFDRLGADLAGVTNRFVLREGVDCPKIGHAILACPFGRRSSYVQACGRVLRPYQNREYAIIQDHFGSSETHPRLDSDEPWDWESPPGLAERIRISELRQNEANPADELEPGEVREPIVCPKCMAERACGDTCPYCGFRYAKHARYVVQVDGTLRLVEGRTHRPRRTTYKHGDERLWERLFYSTTRNSNRTAEQAYVYYAVQNDWRWLPRNLPLMPRYEADWFIPLKNVPFERLHPKSA